MLFPLSFIYEGDFWDICPLRLRHKDFKWIALGVIYLPLHGIIIIMNQSFVLSKHVLPEERKMWPRKQLSANQYEKKNIIKFISKWMKDLHVYVSEYESIKGVIGECGYVERWDTQILPYS